jgi:hypothetical protein
MIQVRGEHSVEIEALQKRVARNPHSDAKVRKHGANIKPTSFLI